MVPSRSLGSLEERDFCIEESDKKVGKTPSRLDEGMNIRSQAAEAPMVSDVVRSKAWMTRDRAVVGTGREPVAAARPGWDGARPGLLALLLS